MGSWKFCQGKKLENLKNKALQFFKKNLVVVEFGKTSLRRLVVVCRCGIAGYRPVWCGVVLQVTVWWCVGVVLQVTVWCGGVGVVLQVLVWCCGVTTVTHWAPPVAG